MHRLDTTRIKGFNETLVDTPTKFEVNVAGRQLNFDQLTNDIPIVTSDYDGVSNSQLEIVAPETLLEPWDENRFYPVGRLAALHGRSLDILADTVAVEDQFGNQYHSLSIKGTDFSDPYFFKSSTAEREYVVNGLQESLVVERVLRASNLMREQGVDTEYICDLRLPDVFPIIDTTGGLDNIQPSSLTQFRELLADDFAQQDRDDKSPMQRKVSILERFQDCDYMLSVRATNCPIRAGELRDPARFQDLRAFVAKNYPELASDATAESYDLTYHMVELFAPNLAHNVGTMHKLGLVHGFLHANNITALGAIVDLDSVRGEPLGLGDEAVSKQDQVEDFALCMQNINHIFNAYEAKTVSILERGAMINASCQAKAMLLEVYLHTRFGDEQEPKVEFLDSLLREVVGIGSIFGDYRQRCITAHLIQDSYREHTVTKEHETQRPLFNASVAKRPTDVSMLHSVPPIHFEREFTTLCDPQWNVNQQIIDEESSGLEVTNRIRHNLDFAIEAGVYQALLHASEETAKIDQAPASFIEQLSSDRLHGSHMLAKSREEFVTQLSLPRFDLKGVGNNQLYTPDAMHTSVFPASAPDGRAIPLHYTQSPAEYYNAVAHLFGNNRADFYAAPYSAYTDVTLQGTSERVFIADMSIVDELIEEPSNMGAFTALLQSDVRTNLPLIGIVTGQDAQSVYVFTSDATECSKLSNRDVIHFIDSVRPSGHSDPVLQQQLIN